MVVRQHLPLHPCTSGLVRGRLTASRKGAKGPPLPRSFANVKRGFSEKKWQDAKAWTGKMLARTGNRKYRPSDRQKPDPTVAKANRRLASRFYQMKTGHCLTGQYLAWITRRPDASCWWCQYKIQTREHLFKNCP